MGKTYIADKVTLDKVRQNTDFIIANLMTLQNDSALKTKVAENYFNTRRTGKVFGVFFNDFSVSNSSVGVRKYDAVNMIAKPSTDKVAARNDFEEYAIFNGLTVNGEVDANGNFVVTYFEGEEGFSNTENDTYILLGTSWVNIDIDSLGETISVTDKPKDGYFPMGGAVRMDNTIRPFIAISKYLASKGKDNAPASISGQVPYYKVSSQSGNISQFHAKGNQYCSTTAQDRFLIETMFQVIFATRNSQSIMRGCTDYNYQYQVAKAETNVNRAIVTKVQGANYVVGSRASIGTKNSAGSLDRYYDEVHKIANRRIITKIEDVTIDGTTYSAVYLDGAAFTTTSDCFLSSMPWHTGACDSVLGSCGSPVNNTNGKFPFVLMGIELMNGQYEVLGNVIYKQTSVDGSIIGKMYVCYDAAKLANSPTADFVEIGYNIANSNNSWKYGSKLGFDKNNPSARLAFVGLDANSGNGYADGQYTSTSANNYEVLVGGDLNSGAIAGLWVRYLVNGVGGTAWYVTARLSATGRCGVAKAA